MTLVYLDTTGEPGRLPAICTDLTPDQVVERVAAALEHAGRGEGVAFMFVAMPRGEKVHHVRADLVAAVVDR